MIRESISNKEIVENIENAEKIAPYLKFELGLQCPKCDNALSRVNQVQICEKCGELMQITYIGLEAKELVAK